MRLPRTLLFGLLLLLPALPAAHAAAPPGVAISDPWMRLLLHSLPVSGYFNIANQSDHAVVLTGASSPLCGMLMLHQSRQSGTTEEMVMVMQVAVPPHGTVSFTPGGYHLMCTAPATALVLGSRVPVRLLFQNGTTLDAIFPVRGPKG